MVALSGISSADDLATFAKNDHLVGSGALAGHEAAVAQNLRILQKVILASDASKVDKALAAYDRAAKANDEGFVTSFSWVSGEKTTKGDLTVVCANYGPVGSVRVWRKGKELALPMKFTAMDLRHPMLVTIIDSSVVIESNFVRDAGMRDNTIVDFLMLGPSGLRLAKSVEAEHTLDWGGASSKGKDVSIGSIDSPKSFIPSNADSILKRTRTYRLVGNQWKLIANQPGDLDLRALDDWLFQAQKAPRPRADQALAKKMFPGEEMLFEMKVVPSGHKAVKVVFSGDNGKLTFLLKRVGKGLAVVGVQKTP